jgi:hypothetical protein
MALRRIRAKRNGVFQIRLEPPERDLLRGLPEQAGALLDQNREDPSLRRLFPTAYPQDRDADADYRTLMGGELFRRHRDALDLLAKTADATELEESDLHAWLGALEVLRLVLGTQLDVGENDRPPPAGDPRSARFAVYVYLGGLQEELITVLSATLSPPAAETPGTTC